MRVLLAVGVAAGLLIPQAETVWAQDIISDAEAIALELSWELLAPPGLVSLIHVHLQAIRSVEPILEVVRAYLPWEPGVIGIQLTISAWDEYQMGTYTGLDSLNAVYGPVAILYELPFARAFWLDFSAHYNPAILGPIYGTATGVNSWTASNYGNTDTDISADSLGTYTFRYGWLSCPLGCVFNHFWTYQINALGEAALQNEWGDPLVGVAAPEIVPVLGGILQAFPNPFTDATRITACITAEAGSKLDVIDVTGRHVRALQRAFPTEGTHHTQWDGRDDRGRSVPGGVYFVVLTCSGGERSAKKVVLQR